MLSTVMITSPFGVISVPTTRTSGISNGIVTWGLDIMTFYPFILPPYLAVTTPTPREPNSLELGYFLAENRIGSRFRHAKRPDEHYNMDAISI
jgi:hypothetical protein